MFSYTMGYLSLPPRPYFVLQLYESYKLFLYIVSLSFHLEGVGHDSQSGSSLLEFPYDSNDSSVNGSLLNFERTPS